MKRLAAWALALIMILSLFPATVWAADTTVEYKGTKHYIAEDELGITNDELFEAYAQREFDAALGIEAPSFYRTSALEAGTLEKEIYDKLRAELAKVAAGAVTSTEITVSPTKAWSKSDLGVTEFVSGNVLTEATDAAIEAKLKLVYTCLLADCPLEMYWHDKTAGMATLPFSCSISGDNLSVTSITYQFAVATDYSATGAAETFATNINKTGATSTAVTNAQAIVAANASKSDLEKLAAYKDKICELVSYDTSAAASSPSVEGINPWQMIYVFDGDEDSNVVCEGYAKAFQFLCDLSSTNTMECHTVTGTMSGGTGAGRHMWNVVTMDDGRNYLVDVTNCDDGTIGAPDKLFMAYTTNSADENQTHTFTIDSQKITFTYDETMEDLFCEGYLDLATTAYKHSSAVSASLYGSSAVQAGTDVTLTLKVSGTNIMGVEATLEYDEDVLEYRSYHGLLEGWDVVPNGTKFVMYGVKDPINEASDVVSVTFRVKSGTTAGTQLSVAFKDITVSDGNEDRTVSTVTWKGAVATPPNIAISEENFPDATFRRLVSEWIDLDRNAVLSADEIAGDTYINCKNKGITSLKGIEYFPNLVSLTCSFNSLESLDISKNTRLKTLECNDNLLANLDVTNNPQLVELSCSANNLTALDISKNTELVSLYCGNNGNVKNKIAVLDTSANAKLETLNCSENLLTALDLSENKALKFLECNGNMLTALDVSNNLALEHLNCENNRITTLNVSNNPGLSVFSCGYNNLAALDVSKNTLLKRLVCCDNALTELDVQNNTLLTLLNCSNNQISSLDVSKNLSMTNLHCGGNQLTLIDVSRNSTLEHFTCNNNQLATLDISNNLLLEILGCDFNQLTTIDVSKNVALTRLYCCYNQLTSLDLSANTALSHLEGYNNSFSVVLDENKRFDLSTLPGSFDVSKAGNWTNGTVSGTILTVTDTNSPVTYDYDCGNNITLSFSLVSDTVTTGGDIAISDENFPDANFRSYVADNFDDDGDGVFSATEIQAVSIINCNRLNISSLAGIEHFTALKSLHCQSNQLTSIDTSQNPLLKVINCSYNPLTSLNVSNNPALESLVCQDSQLASLDVSNNPELGSLSCDINQLSALDVSSNPKLVFLSCFSTQITELDVTNNPALETLHIENNQLTDIDVSYNPRLKEFWCDGNQLTALDVSHNPLLEYFTCTYNALTSIDISHNLVLERLDCHHNQLTSIDVTKNTALKTLFVDNNQLKALDVSKNSALESLYCKSNQLTNLDVSQNEVLTTLWCDWNQLKALDVSKNSALEELDCGSNQLTSIDVSNNPALETFVCQYNQLTSIDVSKNLSMTNLNCSGNQLTLIDVSRNSKLEWLVCSRNQLTSIDVSNNPALETFGCQYNRLTSLDVSNNSKLEWLNCGSNQLTSIDVSNNPALEEFVCAYNRLTSLDVSANTALFFFEGDYNRFSVVLDENKQFDLSTLPGSFDVSKASNWTNGMVSGTILTVTDMNVPVTYEYDCGNDHTVCFTLYLETEISVTLGDANGDGTIDIGDHQRLFEHLQGIDVITDATILAAVDVNKDGVIDIGDHQRLFEHLQGIDPLK